MSQQPESMWDCTLETCAVEESLFQYQPYLGASSAFIALFGLGIVAHGFQCIKWRTWLFSSCVITGCIVEMVGYGGRIGLYNNPFAFQGFLTQIVCITIAPVFFSAAVYLTLHDTIMNLSTEVARFKPKLYYILFIVCDIVSLIFQGTGGGMCANADTGSDVGMNIALVGLSFQVFSMAIFILLSADYAWRYHKAVQTGHAGTIHSRKFNVFVAGLATALLCIFTRCVYRIAELSDGYAGRIFHDQGLFIGLEGVLIVVAVYALNIGHPGLVFDQSPKKPGRQVREESDDSSTSRDLEKLEESPK